MKYTEEQSTMIEDIEKRSEKLSDWESRFIDSISRQNYPLTEKQAAQLDKIWEQVT